MILSAAFALTGRCSASPFSGSRQTRRLPALRSYDFANAGDMRVPGQRRNRNVEKRKAKNMDNIVRGLTHMKEKQLLAVEHLLRPAPGVMDDIAIAAKLPRSNQGRKRQEDLVAKKLRECIDSDAMSKLADAVALASRTQALYQDSAIQDQVDMWKEQLLAGDQAGLQDVLAQALEAGVEVESQQLRQLVRQLQQCLQEEEQEVALAAANSAAAGSADLGGSGSGSDDDIRASSMSGADQPELQMAASTSAGSSSPEAATAGKRDKKEDDEVARLRAQLGQLKPRARSGKRGGQSEAVRLKRQAKQKAENALVKVLKQVAERQVLSGA